MTEYSIIRRWYGGSTASTSTRTSKHLSNRLRARIRNASLLTRPRMSGMRRCCVLMRDLDAKMLDQISANELRAAVTQKGNLYDSQLRHCTHKLESELLAMFKFGLGKFQLRLVLLYQQTHPLPSFVPITNHASCCCRAPKLQRMRWNHHK